METEVNAFLGKLEADSSYSESTQLAYANDLRVFLLHLETIENHSPVLQDLDAHQVANFLEAESKLGRSRNTLVRRLATLTYFQDYLINEGVLAGKHFKPDDARIQLVISKKPENKSSKCLSKLQVQAVLEVLESSTRPRALRDKAIFLLLLDTGLSVASLTALDMTDIDLASKRLHVCLEGVGEVWLEMGNAQSSVQEYIVKGRPNLMHELGEPALFISQMDGRLSRQGIWQILKYWGSQIEPPIPLSPRMVRHSAVLRMREAGVASDEIQIRLGHRNILSTQALIRRLQASCKQ